MRGFASHEPEALAGLQFEQSLHFQLCLGGACQRNPHVNYGVALRLSALERRLDEHEARTPQNSIDQKEVVEPICVNRRNSPPLHSNVLPALVGFAAEPGKNCTLEPSSSSKFDSAPHYYGLPFPNWNRFATVAGAT